MVQRTSIDVEETDHDEEDDDGQDVEEYATAKKNKPSPSPYSRTPRNRRWSNIERSPESDNDVFTPDETFDTHSPPKLNGVHRPRFNAIPASPSSRSSSTNASVASVLLPIKPTEPSSKGLSKTSSTIPSTMEHLLDLQKRVSLKTLYESPIFAEPESGEHSTAMNATTSLYNMLKGTTERGEGNSCLVLGPRRSGKTRV
jgi:origin recognition complex subunit 4